MPARYNFTRRGWAFLQSWCVSKFEYSILQIALGSNPISKLEVVSAPNVLSYAVNSLFYSTKEDTAKYNPMVYLGTISATSSGWIYDGQDATNQVKIDPNTWPQSNTQKGEANNQKFRTMSFDHIQVNHQNQ